MGELSDWVQGVLDDPDNQELIQTWEEVKPILETCERVRKLSEPIVITTTEATGGDMDISKAPPDGPEAIRHKIEASALRRKEVVSRLSRSSQKLNAVMRELVRTLGGEQLENSHGTLKACPENDEGPPMGGFLGGIHSQAVVESRLLEEALTNVEDCGSMVGMLLSIVECREKAEEVG